MQVTDIIAQLGGAQSIARELGVTESQASAGIAALLPSILGGFRKQASSQGMDGLTQTLTSLGGGDLLDNVTAAAPTDVGKGNQLLGQIFGSKDVSRAVAQNAAGATGLDPAVLRKMLPIVAMLAAGYMARSGGAANAASPSVSPSASSAGGILGSVLGGLMGGGKGGAAAGGLASMLDANGDGNPLDDILRMMKK